jgi:hypothetical protein
MAKLSNVRIGRFLTIYDLLGSVFLMSFRILSLKAG